MQSTFNNPEKPLEIPWEAQTFGVSAGIIVDFRERRAEALGFLAGVYAGREHPDKSAEEMLANWNNDKPEYRVE